MKPSLKFALMSLFGPMAVLAFSQGIASLLSLRTIHAGVIDITTRWTPSVDTRDQFQTAVPDDRALGYRYLTAETEADCADVFKHFAVLDVRMESPITAYRRPIASPTDEIGQRIAPAQGLTDEALRAIGGIGKRIRKIKAIAVAVEEQGAVPPGIVRNVPRASAGMVEVTSGMVGVVRASENKGAAAVQVLASASELPRQPEHLSAEVARFLATLRIA